MLKVSGNWYKGEKGLSVYYFFAVKKNEGN